MKHGNEHVKTECREYGVFSAYCVVATKRWRTPRNVYDRRTGGREWESNPPRTGKRLFPGFEVRTPHRGRFSSFLNDRNCLMTRTTENEGAKLALGPKLDAGCSNGVLQHAFDDCTDDARPQTPAGRGMTQSSSAACATLVPNRFGDF
jgi:hypothetical protein